LALGYEPGEAETSAADVLLDSLSLMGARRSTDIRDLDLIPGESRIETAEQFLPVRPDHMTTLRRALQASAPMSYDYVLIDCPPALGSITTNALGAADLLIIPTQPEYFSAYALRNMMSLIRKVRQDGNPNLAYRILVTMLDRRNRSHRNIYEQLRSTFHGVLTTVIEIDTKLQKVLLPAFPSPYKSSTRGFTIRVSHRVINARTSD
jgi:chromosome partitioning protein